MRHAAEVSPRPAISSNQRKRRIGRRITPMT
jgi:hypothetical protein